MRWWHRLAWVVVGFVVPLVAVYNIFALMQPAHHDLSDIGTGLLGLLFGVVAGLVGTLVALASTRNRPH